MWRGYILIEITTKLTNDTIDNDGVITEIGTKSLVKSGLHELGTQSGLAHLITHSKQSLDGQKIIVELELNIEITKSQICNKLAKNLPWSVNTISNNLTFRKFNGDNWEERNQAVKQYLKKNKSEWEVENG